MIEILKQQANSSVHDLKLDIEQNGMIITIKAGNIRINEQDYNISEDFIHEVEQQDIRRIVRAYLVVDSFDNIQILIDDRHFQLEPINISNIDGYTHLMQLYHFNIPENADTLDDVKIIVRNIVSDQEV